MKKLQRYDVQVASWGSCVEDIKSDGGDYVLDIDVDELEEMVVRLEAGRDDLLGAASWSGMSDDALLKDAAKAGDDAVAKWKKDNA